MSKHKKHRVYEQQFKQDAVDLVVTQGRSVASVARNPGIDQGTWYGWKRVLVPDTTNSAPYGSRPAAVCSRQMQSFTPTVQPVTRDGVPANFCARRAFARARGFSCYAHAITETAYDTINIEFLLFKTLLTRSDAHRRIFHYINAVCSARRRHAALGNLSPGSSSNHSQSTNERSIFLGPGSGGKNLNQEVYRMTTNWDLKFPIISV